MNSETPRDHATPDPAAPSNVEENLKSKSTWLRLLFILVFGVIYALSRLVVFAVITLQFFWLLITGETNARLVATGQSLATYTYQLVRYMTFNTERKPFPFDDDWPSTTPL